MNQEKAERLAKVREEIQEACSAAGRRAEEVRLIAVSKTKGWESVRDFLALGQQEFGENYVQEALKKAEALTTAEPERAQEARWHFLGTLQSNKAKFLPGNFTLFHALDSLHLAEKLDQAARAKGAVQGCLVEVNVDEEKTKGGIRSDALLPFLTQLANLDALEIQGLMCIPAAGSGPAPFARLRTLLEAANRSGAYRQPLKELSMGMSADFPSAIREGATMVRVGTALFGPRER